jgi:hypothetical protein
MAFPVASSLVGVWSGTATEEGRKIWMIGIYYLLLFENFYIFLCKFLKMRFLKQLL